MPFPWELNLDRPYHDEKWRFLDERAWAESPDSEFGDPAELLGSYPADNENRHGAANGG
jgi:hypothetical protein